MYYSELEARKTIIRAGHELLDKGLVARTWGNISARISENEFIITPSGRAYDTLRECDLVKVNITDGSYSGSMKPSMERTLHSGCYAVRPCCCFIIHTHQMYASVIGIEGRDFPFAACTGYGLPGTDALAKSVRAGVSAHPDANSFIMKNHGPVILGCSFEDALARAEQLEKDSMAAFLTASGLAEVPDEEDYIGIIRAKTGRLRPYIDDFAQLYGLYAKLNKSTDKLCGGEDAWAKKRILIKNAAAALYADSLNIRPIGAFEVILQRIVYVFKYSRLKDKHKA